jgi:hypothetical protein
MPDGSPEVAIATPSFVDRFRPPERSTHHIANIHWPSPGATNRDAIMVAGPGGLQSSIAYQVYVEGFPTRTPATRSTSAIAPKSGPSPPTMRSSLATKSVFSTPGQAAGYKHAIILEPSSSPPIATPKPCISPGCQTPTASPPSSAASNLSTATILHPVLLTPLFDRPATRTPTRSAAGALPPPLTPWRNSFPWLRWLTSDLTPCRA